MALTKLDKQILDGKVREYLDSLATNNTHKFTRTDVEAIYDELHLEFSMVSIMACLNRMEISWNYNKYRHEFDISNKRRIRVNSGFEKEKNILHMYTDKGIILNYNFATGKMETDLENIEITNIYDYNTYLTLLKNEWLYNYCKDFYRIKEIVSSFKRHGIDYATMPKGLYDYIKEYGSLSESVIEKYWFYNEFKVSQDNLFVQGLLRDFNYDSLSALLTHCKIDDILKCAKLNVINGKYQVINDNISKMINIFRRNPEIEFTLDTNRDLSHNEKCLTLTLDKEKNEKLAQKMQKLNFINGLTIGNYVVVVPQSQLEKMDEGEQQNNCVGYYYDNSILNNENLIYFLRKVSNPTKSYMTCRYNLRSKNTDEYRLKNNASVTNQVEKDIVKQISETIKKYFEENK